MPNEAGRYVGGILGLIGGYMAAKGQHETKQAEDAAKFAQTQMEKDADQAVQNGDIGWFDRHDKALKTYLPKELLEAKRGLAEHSAQTKGFAGMMKTLDESTAQGASAAPSMPAAAPQAPGAGMTEQNITGQPSALPVAGPADALRLLRPQTAFPENPVPGQGAGIGSPAPTPTAAPAPAAATAPAAGGKSMVQRLRDIGLQPEISTDAKGNVITRTIPLAKTTPEEAKSQAMATIAKDEVKNLPPEQQPVAMAKSFLRQSVDMIRAGHVPNSLEANTAYGITESAHNAFPDDADLRAKYIVAASQAAKQYQEQNDPRLKMEQKRYDLSVQQYNRELANDRENVRAKAETRLDTEINQVQAQVARNQGLLVKSEPNLLAWALGSKIIGGAESKAKYAAYGALQTQIARDQEHLQRLQQLQSSYANAKNPPAPGPSPAPGPGAAPAVQTPPDKMRIREKQSGKEYLYPVGPVPDGYSRLQ